MPIVGVVDDVADVGDASDFLADPIVQNPIDLPLGKVVGIVLEHILAVGNDDVGEVRRRPDG